MRDLSAAIRNQPPAEYSHDREPTYAAGAVQGYGVLIIADARTREISFISENAHAFLNLDVSRLLGRSYLSIFSDASEKQYVESNIKPDTILFPNPVRLTCGGRQFDVTFHAQNDKHLIEIELADEIAQSYGDLSDQTIIELFNPKSVEELYQRAVRVIRQMTGFDRVMLYRFDARFNGQVLAESAREGVGSFLGLFFPSSDIGPRVRDLYLKNFTRYIPDIGAKAFPLIGRTSSDLVDLTYVNLRGVQPCHITYLQNMGVQASMSFSINIDNKLWGLFACHHYAPRLVSYERRVVCEQAAMMFIFKLTMMSSAAARLVKRQQDLSRIGQELVVGATLARRIAALEAAWADPAEQDAARPMVSRVLTALQAETSWLVAPPAAAGRSRPDDQTVSARQQLLLDLVEADSAAVIRHGQVYCIGDAPPEMAVFAIASMFGRELPDLHAPNLPVFATDTLCSIAPVTEAIKDRAAGLLAVSLSDTEPAYLIWFRREQIVHATWAGNPTDSANNTASGQNPRASFAAWKQDIRNLSRPWLLEDVEVAVAVLEVVRAADGISPKPLTVQTAVVWPPAQGPLPWPVITQPASSAPARPAQSVASKRVIRVGTF